jgi:DNA-binding transcriptional ArsR family regulator
MPPCDGPDISAVAALVAEPARARMLAALMSGQALTATELATEAGIAPSTASGHLARLERASVIAVVRQGRHRYFRIASHETAAALEGLMTLAARRPERCRGPADPNLRFARVCFDHLAGTVAVTLADAWLRRGIIEGADRWSLTTSGARFFEEWGIDVPALRAGRRPLVRECLDWSERRFHLGGALGAAVLDAIVRSGWAVREPGSRILSVTAAGERGLGRLADPPAPGATADAQLLRLSP